MSPGKVKSNNSDKKTKNQGSILSFVKSQPSEKLLKSKDGLKQGKLDCFMKPKKGFHQELPKLSYSPSKKRQDCDLLENSPAKRAKIVPGNIVASVVLTTEDVEENFISKVDKSKIVHSLSSETDFIEKSKENYNLEDSNELMLPASSANKNDRSESPVLKTTKRKLLLSEKSPLPLENKILKHSSNDKVDYKNVSANVEEEQILCNKENMEHQSDANPTSLTTNFSITNPPHKSTDSEVTSTTDTAQAVASNNEIEFEELEDLNFSLFEDDMQQATKERSNNELFKCRYKVLEVGNAFNEKGYEVKRLLVENKRTGMKSSFDLQDDCADLNIEIGDVVNIIADDNSSPNLVSSMQNLVVHHPDTLISGTTVSNALGCIRRAVLSERFKNTELVGVDDVTNIMLIGTLAHSVFQKALLLNKPITKALLTGIAESTITEPRYLKDLVALRTTKQIILAEVTKYVPQIHAWLGEYHRKSVTRGVGQLEINTPSPNINGKPCHKTNRYKASVAMTEVQDIEENVWSPRFGLKGKIDVTGKFMIKNNQTNQLLETVLPVEIKTGRDSNSMEHHIQVAIYSLFCDERRNLIGQPGSLATGLLLYLKTNKMFSIPMKRTDKHGMIMLRNKIADHLVKTLKLGVDDKNEEVYETNSFPDTIRNSRICQRCSQLRNCALVHRSVDHKNSACEPATDLQALFKEKISHLAEDDLAYFRHWMTCTFVEAKEVGKREKMKRFWLKTPKQRCEKGSCINELKLAGNPIRKEKSDRLQQSFKRSDSHQNQSTPSKEKDIFEVGEMVLISGQEPEFIAMATAIVDKINSDFITVSTDRDFSKYDQTMKYSIDRHVWMSQISVQSSLANLSMLMDNDVHCNRLRNLLIAHNDPTFRQSLDFIPRSSKDEVAKMLRGLNRTQRQAIKRVLLSNDYTLVVGMPGSGKTTTIVAMIQILLLCGLRVLVTSYTHSAVDNLLIKLIKYKVKFLRLGRNSQIHPTIQPFSEENLSEGFTEAKQLHALYNQARVVGCTCLAVTSHTFFAIPGQGRTIFDVCIVDEASQITQPACLSPLMQAKRFVLVGDHQQLPPLVVSTEARKMGADESLFWRLTRHKSAVCDLTLQYRMNSDIMGLSNHVTYQGRLECAKPLVAVATVTLDRIDKVKKKLSHHEDADWLLQCLEPKVSVLFLDTSAKSYYEQEVDNGLVNNDEAQILSKITQNLLEAGSSCKDIGIISPFRKQLSVIEEKVNSILPSDQQNLVEINTVDKYQGRDKSVILLSFVRSRPDKLAEKKGELLNDWRRLNVAVTRAKHKLVMVGCVRSLLEYEPCEKLIKYLCSKNMVYQL